MTPLYNKPAGRSWKLQESLYLERSALRTYRLQQSLRKTILHVRPAIPKLVFKPLDFSFPGSFHLSNTTRVNERHTVRSGNYAFRLGKQRLSP